MALDEPQNSDLTFTEQGITFAIEKELFEDAKPIRIDFVDSPTGAGFQLTSSLSSADGCC
jgi:Fe-S cluster assembly iron-binding protein IscA